MPAINDRHCGSVPKSLLNNNILAIAKDIEAYLLNHPTAADTLVGVTQWWLTRQRYEQSFEKVTMALDLLVERRRLNAQIN